MIQKDYSVCVLPPIFLENTVSLEFEGGTTEVSQSPEVSQVECL